MLTQEIFHKKM